jgi:hypothetical protein
MIEKILEGLKEYQKEYKSGLGDFTDELVDRVLRNAIAIVQEESKDGGWIPTENELPTKRDWYLALFKEPDTDFVLIPKVADYLMGVHTKYTTEEGWIIADCTDTERDGVEYYKKLKCIAWKPIAPYQKGE